MDTTSNASIHGRISWPGSSSIKQAFSLPDSLIYFITKNPSTPKCYSKLIKSCKHFFEENPILVVKKFSGSGSMCSSDSCRKKCCVRVDLKKLTSKIWLTKKLKFYACGVPDMESLICPKIYKCEISYLDISNTTIILDDFKILVAPVKELRIFGYSKITSNDEKSTVMIENFFEALLNIERFKFQLYDRPFGINASSLKNLAKLQNFKRLKEFNLSKIPQLFNVEDLYSFITNDECKKIRLRFLNISQEYMNQLDDLIDRLIEFKFRNFLILYNRQDEKKLEIMKNFWFRLI